MVTSAGRPRSEPHPGKRTAPDAAAKGKNRRTKNVEAHKPEGSQAPTAQAFHIQSLPSRVQLGTPIFDDRLKALFVAAAAMSAAATNVMRQARGQAVPIHDGKCGAFTATS